MALFKNYFWQLVCISLFLINSLILYLSAPSADSHFEMDSYVYDLWGRYFAQTSMLYDPALTHVPMQPVGYHAIIGIIYSLFGCDHRWVLALQVVLALGCLVLVYAIAQKLYGLLVARMSMFFCAFHIGFLVYSQLVLTEISITFLSLLFIERVLCWLEDQSPRYIFHAWCILSVSVFIKPIALVYVYPFSLFVLMYTKGRWLYRLKQLAIGLAIFYLPLLVYMYRNYILYGSFTFAPMMAVNVCQFVCKIMARVHGQPYEAVLAQYMPDQTQFFNPAAWEPVYHQLRHCIWTYPITVCYVWGLNVIKTVGGLFGTQLKVFLNPAIKGGACSYFSQSAITGLLNYITFGASSGIVVFVCCLEACMNAFRLVLIPCGLYVLKNNRAVLLLCISFIATSILITGTDGCARYRMPAEGLLVIFMSAGIVQVSRWFRKVTN